MDFCYQFFQELEFHHKRPIYPVSEHVTFQSENWTMTLQSWMRTSITIKGENWKNNEPLSHLSLLSYSEPQERSPSHLKKIFTYLLFLFHMRKEIPGKGFQSLLQLFRIVKLLIFILRRKQRLNGYPISSSHPRIELSSKAVVQRKAHYALPMHAEGLLYFMVRTCLFNDTVTLHWPGNRQGKEFPSCLSPIYFLSKYELICLIPFLLWSKEWNLPIYNLIQSS